MSASDSPSALITIQEAASLCGGLHPQTLVRWSAKGKFAPLLRLGSTTRPTLRYRRVDVERFLAEQGAAHA